MPERKMSQFLKILYSIGITAAVLGAIVLIASNETLLNLAIEAVAGAVGGIVTGAAITAGVVLVLYLLRRPLSGLAVAVLRRPIANLIAQLERADFDIKFTEEEPHPACPTIAEPPARPSQRRLEVLRERACRTEAGQRSPESSAELVALLCNQILEFTETRSDSDSAAVSGWATRLVSRIIAFGLTTDAMQCVVLDPAAQRYTVQDGG